MAFLKKNGLPRHSRKNFQMLFVPYNFLLVNLGVVMDNKLRIVELEEEELTLYEDFSASTSSIADTSLIEELL